MTKRGHTVHITAQNDLWSRQKMVEKRKFNVLNINLKGESETILKYVSNFDLALESIQ